MNTKDQFIAKLEKLITIYEYAHFLDLEYQEIEYSLPEEEFVKIVEEEKELIVILDQEKYFGFYYDISQFNWFTAKIKSEETKKSP